MGWIITGMKIAKHKPHRARDARISPVIFCSHLKRVTATKTSAFPKMIGSSIARKEYATYRGSRVLNKYILFDSVVKL